MKIVNAGYTIMDPIIENARDYIYKKIERVGRTCYKSEDKITEDSAAKFITNLVKDHHEAMLEHASMTVLFTVDRGVSHELVRHRMASFAQESTRYCNYSQGKFGGELTFIKPCYFDCTTEEIYDYKSNYMNVGYYSDADYCDLNKHEREIALAREWALRCKESEASYLELLNHGCTPEEARAVLPNSLKTDIIVTANMRE